MSRAVRAGGRRQWRRSGGSRGRRGSGLVGRPSRSSLVAATTRQSTGSAVRAQPSSVRSCKHAQQLDLHGDRHGLDLVEEEGAAVGVLDLADAPFGRAGRRRPRGRRFRSRTASRAGRRSSMATKLPLRACWLRAGSAPRVLCRCRFRPGSAHVGGAVGEAGDHLPQAFHRLGVADQARLELVAASRGPQVAHLEDRRRFERAAHDFDEMVGRETASG